MPEGDLPPAQVRGDVSSSSPNSPLNVKAAEEELIQRAWEEKLMPSQME
jgi:hypothetical protein